MEEIAPAANAVFSRKVRPPIDIAATALMTMGVVFLISSFSIGTAITVGSFAGFCVAAWNWLRMGRRRKALAHLIAAFGVYILMLIVSALIGIFLAQLFVRSVPTQVATPAIGDLIPPTSGVVNVLQNGAVPAVGMVVFSLIAGALVVAYLYLATARDVRQYEAAGDSVELYNFLPLLGIAAISATFISGGTNFVAQIPVAQFQNHIYCEVLQPGMSLYEVSQALDKIGPNYRFDVPKGTTPHAPGVSYYQAVIWKNIRFDVRYDLSLQIGFTTESKLASVERYWYDFGRNPDEGSDVVICPWTIFNSLAAK